MLKESGYNLLSKMLKLDVLILILMEHAQRDCGKVVHQTKATKS